MFGLGWILFFGSWILLKRTHTMATSPAGYSDLASGLTWLGASVSPFWTVDVGQWTGTLGFRTRRTIGSGAGRPMIARAGFLQRRSISTPGVIVPRGDSLPTRQHRRGAPPKVWATILGGARAGTCGHRDQICPVVLTLLPVAT